MQNMSRNVMEKSLLLDLQDKINKVVKDIDNSVDLGEIAYLYKKVAKICRETQKAIKELGDGEN